MFYHCLQDQNKTSKSYEYKLKSVIKKKISKLLDRELPLMSSLFPNLNLDLANESGQACRPLNVMVAGSIQHFTLLLNLKQRQINQRTHDILIVRAGFKFAKLS